MAYYVHVATRGSKTTDSPANALNYIVYGHDDTRVPLLGLCVLGSLSDERQLASDLASASNRRRPMARSRCCSRTASGNQKLPLPPWPHKRESFALAKAARGSSGYDARLALALSAGRLAQHCPQRVAPSMHSALQLGQVRISGSAPRSSMSTRRDQVISRAVLGVGASVGVRVSRLCSISLSTAATSARKRDRPSPEKWSIRLFMGFFEASSAPGRSREPLSASREGGTGRVSVHLMYRRGSPFSHADS